MKKQPQTIQRARNTSVLSPAEPDFHLLFDEVRDAILFVRLSDGRILWANRAAVTMYGYSQEELLAKQIRDIRAETTLGSLQERMRQAQETGILFETLHRRKDGKIFPVEVSAKGSDFAGERVNLSIIRDISDRFLAEQALRESEGARQEAVASSQSWRESFRSLIELSPDAVIIHQDGRLIYINPTGARLYGVKDPAQMVGMPVMELIPPESRAKNMEILARIAQGEILPPLEEKIILRDGSRMDVEIVGAPILFQGKQAFQLILRDIHERVRAQEILRESESRLKALIDSSPLGVHMFTLDAYDRLIFTGANPAADRILGIDHQALIGKTLLEAFPGNFGTNIPDIYRTIAASGGTHAGENVAYQDGEIAGIFEIHAFQTGPGRMAVFFRDVTQAHKAEKALRDSEETFRAFIEKNSEGIILYDEQGRAIEWNAAQEQISGISRAEILGRPAWDLLFQLISPDEKSLARYAAMKARGLELIRNQQSPIFYRPIDASIYRADGKRVFIQQATFPIQTNAGLRIGSITRDVTEQKRAERKIQVQLERLAALRTIDSAITRKLPLDEGMEVVLEQVIKHLGGSAADILLLNREKNLLEYGHGKGFHTSLIETTRIPIGEGVAGAIASQHLPMKVADLAKDPRFSRGSLLEAEHFTAYHGAPLIANGEVLGVLEVFHREELEDEQEWVDYFETLAGQAAIAIEDARMFQELRSSNVLLSQAYDETIEGWSRAMDLRDHETEGHSRRVMELSVRLAQAMGLSEEQLIDIRRGALLHDIGKVGVPDAFLLKPGALTAEEWAIMRRHPQYAFDLLSPITYLRRSIEIPYCHHEKWDGSGYPRGLKGEEIPVAARIFAIVDIWDALTSDRPYRLAWPKKKTIQHIQDQSGKHLDPNVVEHFLNMMAEEK